MRIHVLPQSIVSKIAAGEVIERPVYAVKELIENAIDAQATSITIHIEESGFKTITVIDNGHGMSPEDLQECFKHHSTSKITSEEDLNSIHSLGFRGEALSSIAAISTMTIKSRTAQIRNAYKATQRTKRGNFADWYAQRNSYFCRTSFLVRSRKKEVS